MRPGVKSPKPLYGGPFDLLDTKGGLAEVDRLTLSSASRDGIHLKVQACCRCLSEGGFNFHTKCIMPFTLMSLELMWRLC